MSLIPGPRGGLNAWTEFHKRFVDLIHHHPDLLACTWHGRGWRKSPREWGVPLHAESPWTQGACNILATAMGIWINDGARVKQWILSIRPYDPHIHSHVDDADYTHTLISYESRIGRIYMDGTVWTLKPRELVDLWEAFDIHRVTRREADYMAEHFIVPHRAKVQRVVDHLNHALGRWPRARVGNSLILPWELP